MDTITTLLATLGAASGCARRIIQNRPYTHPARERAIIGYLDGKRG